MSLNKNLLKNAGASFISKISHSLIRILQVPLLIYFLGVEDFGRWTVLYTIPSWLTLANFGFGIVAANQITIHIAEDNIKEANTVYSSTLTILSLILLIGLLGVFLFAPIVNWESFLKARTEDLRETEFVNSVIIMSLTVFLSFFYGVFSSAFRSARKMHLDILLLSTRSWLNLLAMFIALNISKKFDVIALAILISHIIFFTFYAIISNKVMPSLKFSTKFIRTNTFKELFKKGIAFQAFPLGSALSIQGNILIIQILLGPVSVALYSTIKTITNIVKQLIDVINESSWSELSYLIGSRDYKNAIKVHRYGLAISIWVSFLGMGFLVLFGEFIYNLWTGNKIDMPLKLFLLMLLPIPLNALWNTSSVVLMASNLHEKLAVRYSIYSIIAFVFAWVLTYYFQLEGTAISLLVLEVLLVPYVIKSSIKLTKDNWSDFKTEILHILPNFPKILLVKIKSTFLKSN